MKIPFSPPYINDNVIKEVTEALESGWITTGPKVKKLEELVAHYTKAPNVLGVNSATSGLMLALKWFGIGEGDEAAGSKPRDRTSYYKEYASLKYKMRKAPAHIQQLVEKAKASSVPTAMDELRRAIGNVDVKR